MKKKYNMPQTEEQSVNLCFSVMVSSLLNTDPITGESPTDPVVGE